ncbi:Retrovirus-related Pol polyprotein from type-1 retrotransposable element R1 [Sarcoptes scabiei]|uniref:Retrovirus-related Pol polyprotein from type-1 retrotransposable element R1 n=1 Tax=Sarcoptes scabiei TaxID=52283 RepID=A0A834VDS1_SARSC|nr:Retrovirus-related Pol polyprotein from type-1 retrotransposable element R1 [Sarcoptes scabiei]
MTSHIRIAQQNTRKSLMATKELLSEFQKHKIDLVLVQEPNTQNTNRILGYPLQATIHQVGNNSKPKTGIVINNKTLYTKTLDNYTNSWMTSIQVQLDKTQLIISNIYIEPNTMIDEHIETLRNLLKDYEHLPLILAGDFNARHTLWHDRIVNKHGELICELINDFDLQIHNENSPTCITDNGNSIIDLTLSNSRATPHIKQWNSKGPLSGIFDHVYITFEFSSKNIPHRTPFSTRKFDEKKADWTKFHKHFSADRIKKLTKQLGKANNPRKIDQIIRQFTRSIQNAAYHSIPIIKTSPYLRRCNWWDDELRCMQIVVRNKRYIFSREKNPQVREHYYNEFRSFRNKYVRMIRRKKFLKWKEFLEELHSQDTWGNTYKMIKHKTNPKSHTLPIIEDFPVKEHPMIMEKIVNQIFPSQASRSSPNFSLDRIGNTTQHINLTRDYIESLIHKTNSKKAPGIDCITNGMLKQIKNLISNFLAKLFEKCLNIGYFPKQWKKGALTIFPKPNKADLHNSKNYRPITLLSSIGKLLEKIIQTNIQNYLIETKKLNSNQHGFVPEKSTITALFEIKKKILNCKADRLTSILAIDFTGAFDNADWDIILQNMTNLNIPSYLIRIISSYFHNRQIIFTYNKHRYSKATTHGCPQGSPLSPLLWNILINNLLDTFSVNNASIFAYADDITIVCSGKNIKELHNTILTALEHVNTWSISNNLTINFNKTNILNFHKKSFPSPIIINDNLVEIVPKIKILGLTFENHHLRNKINFTTHINNTINKTINVKNILNNYCKNTFGINTRKRQNLRIRNLV